MLGIGRRDGAVEVKHSVKNVLATPPRSGGIGNNVQPAIASRPASTPATQARDDSAAPVTRAKDSAAAPAASATPELYAPGLGLGRVNTNH